MREAILTGLPLENSRSRQIAVPKVGHDLARFDRRRKVRETVTEKEHIEARARMRARELERRKELSAQGVSAFAALGFLSVIILMVMVIFSHVRLAELSGDTARLKSELAMLKTQEAELRSEYERSLNLDSIENEAETLYGMTKPGREQIIYIDLSKPDSAEIIRHDGIKEVKDGLAGVGENFLLLLEYLR